MSPVAVPEPDITIQEASQLLGISRYTLVRWAKKGHVASRLTPTGVRRFRRSDIEELAERMEKEGAA